jgi:hypothetical protein
VHSYELLASAFGLAGAGSPVPATTREKQLA